MDQWEAEGDNLLCPEIRHALRALRHAINVTNSFQANHRFQASFQNAELEQMDRYVREFISIVEERALSLHEDSIQAVENAQRAFHQLTARNRRKMRAYYRDDLRTYLDIQPIDDPLDILGEKFQDTQYALFRAVSMRRTLLHLRRIILVLPQHLRALGHPVFERLIRENQQDVTTLEYDQVTTESLLNVRFQGLSEDEQNVFWRWYEGDMKACGFQRVSGTRYFRFTAIRPAIVVTEHD